jgi:hypothetical protein
MEDRDETKLRVFGVVFLLSQGTICQHFSLLRLCRFLPIHDFRNASKATYANILGIKTTLSNTRTLNDWIFILISWHE